LALHSFPTRRSSDLKASLWRLLSAKYLALELRDLRGVGAAEDLIPCLTRHAVKQFVAKLKVADTLAHGVGGVFAVGEQVQPEPRSEEHTSELQSREN